MTGEPRENEVARSSLRTPLLLCLAAIISGAAIGVATNAINGQVSRDYFAIVMSWDWQAAPLLALALGAIEGGVLGLFFGVVLAIVIAASTRLRWPLSLALRGLALGIVIVLSGWLIGGICGTVLARLQPRLWGFVFVGVPPRVNLPRFAWVGGSIWGAYAGAAGAAVVASVYLHITWRRRTAPAFAVMTAAATDAR